MASKKSEPTTSWQDRVKAERKEVDDRTEKLGAFINTDDYNKLDTVDRADLVDQYQAMRDYRDVLDRRLARMDEQKTEGGDA